MSEKTLSNTDMETATANVKDIVVHGDPGRWVCVCKASSKREGWMKSMKVFELAACMGCLVQVSTQQGDNVAEAITFVPGATLGHFKED